MFSDLGHLQLFKFDRANDLVVKMKFLQLRSNVTIREIRPQQTWSMTEQNITETQVKI